MAYGRHKADWRGRKKSSFPVPVLLLHFKLGLRLWSGFRLPEFWFWFHSLLAGGPWACYLSSLCSSFFICKMDIITVPQSMVVMKDEVVLTKAIRIVPDVVNTQWIVTIIISIFRIIWCQTSHLTVLDLSFLDSQMREVDLTLEFCDSMSYNLDKVKNHSVLKYECEFCSLRPIIRIWKSDVLYNRY